MYCKRTGRIPGITKLIKSKFVDSYLVHVCSTGLHHLIGQLSWAYDNQVENIDTYVVLKDIGTYQDIGTFLTANLRRYSVPGGPRVVFPPL